MELLKGQAERSRSPTEMVLDFETSVSQVLELTDSRNRTSVVLLLQNPHLTTKNPAFGEEA